MPVTAFADTSFNGDGSASIVIGGEWQNPEQTPEFTITIPAVSDDSSTITTFVYDASEGVIDTITTAEESEDLNDSTDSAENTFLQVTIETAFQIAIDALHFLASFRG